MEISLTQTHECGNWAEAAEFLFWEDINSNFFPVPDIGNYYFLAAEVYLRLRVRLHCGLKLLTFAEFLLNFYVNFFSLNFLDFVKHNVHGIPGSKDLLQMVTNKFIANFCGRCGSRKYIPIWRKFLISLNI